MQNVAIAHQLPIPVNNLSAEEQMNRLLVSLHQRMGFTEFKYLMQDQNIAIGRTDGRIPRIVEQLLRPENNNKYNYIADVYRDHILYGEKSVQFFHVTPELMSELVRIFREIDLDRSPMSQLYPLPLHQDDLRDLYRQDQSSPLPIAKEHNGLAVIFGSVRYFTSQNKIDVSRVSVSDFDRLAEGHIEEAYVKTYIYRQFFDAIILRPNSNLIELLVDSPETQEQNQSMQQRARAFDHLISWLTGVSRHHRLNLNNYITQAIELRPIISPLCRDREEGLLKKVYFITDEGLEDKAYAKQTEINKDLREDNFLRGGENSVPIDIYRGSISWLQTDRQIDDYIPQLKLHLLGPKPRASGSGTLSLKFAIINGARSQRDYSFLCGKLFKYLDDYDY